MRERKSKFPPDLAVLLGLFWILVPAAALGSWVFSAISQLKNEGDLTILWLAMAIAATGLSLLIWGRFPLYRARRFFEPGPGSLDPKHRRIYWSAWALVLLSVVLFGSLIALVR